MKSRYANTSRHGRRRADWRALAAWAAIGMLLVAGVILVVSASRAAIPTDSETLCRSDRKAPESITAILIDVSDQLTEAQRLAVKNQLQAVQRSVPKFGVLDVYSLDSDQSAVIRPVLTLCNPGDGDGMNRLYQNPELALKKWDAFQRRVDAEVNRLIGLSGANQSPIMEAIQAVALRTFNRPEAVESNKSLYIVSDLLQHVPGHLSQYERIVPFETFSHTPYYNQVRADLRGVSVSFLYIVRPSAPQKWPEHRLFWEELIRAENGSVERIEPIFGGK